MKNGIASSIYIYLILSKLLLWVICQAIEQGAPRLAHPPNQVHVDKRFGIPIEPGIELFTNDVIVISIRETSPIDGSSIFRVWSMNDDGSIICTDPRSSNAYGNFQYQDYDNKYGKAYGTNKYNSKEYKNKPDYGIDEYGEYEATLTQMFVVNVVDGRLGMMTLTPVVLFPASPKYISPEPIFFRSGVYSTIGTDGWIPGDEILKVNSYIPPAEPFIIFPIEFGSSTSYGEFVDGGGFGKSSEPSGTYTYGSANTRYSEQSHYVGGDGHDDKSNYGRIAIRGSTFHDFLRCDGGHLVSTFLGDRDLGFFPTPTTLTSIFSYFQIDKVPHQIVRRMMEIYQASISGGLPRTFLLFSHFPFTDAVHSISFHGAEAQLSSRRVFLGQIRIVARSTKLEQQATIQITSSISDSFSFSFDVGFTESAAIQIKNVPVIILRNITDNLTDKLFGNNLFNLLSVEPSNESGPFTTLSVGPNEIYQYNDTRLDNLLKRSHLQTSKKMETMRVSPPLPDKRPMDSEIYNILGSSLTNTLNSMFPDISIVSSLVQPLVDSLHSGFTNPLYSSQNILMSEHVRKFNENATDTTTAPNQAEMDDTKSFPEPISIIGPTNLLQPILEPLTSTINTLLQPIPIGNMFFKDTVLSDKRNTTTSSFNDTRILGTLELNNDKNDIYNINIEPQTNTFPEAIKTTTNIRPLRNYVEPISPQSMQYSDPHRNMLNNTSIPTSTVDGTVLEEPMQDEEPISPLNLGLRRVKTLQSSDSGSSGGSEPNYNDAVKLTEEVSINFGFDFQVTNTLSFQGEYTILSPPNTAHVGHINQHIGYSQVPFTLDMGRQENFWTGQWIADMHLPPDPVAVNSISNVGITTNTVFGHPMETMRREDANVKMPPTRRLQNDAAISIAKNKLKIESDLQDQTPTERTNYLLQERNSDEYVFNEEINKAAFDSKTDNNIKFSNYERKVETFRDNSTTTLSEPSPFNEDCFQPLITNNPTPFTVRRASVERDLFSLVNPLGIVHPAMEIHHFAVSGVYSSTNTYFMDFIIERVS